MENRLKFLYHTIAELWGHGRIEGAGSGKTGLSNKERQRGKTLCCFWVVMGSEMISSEAFQFIPSRKAAIVYCMPVP